MNVTLDFTVLKVVQDPSLVQQDHSQIHQAETSAIHALKAFTVSHLNLIEMNLLDIAFVLEVSIVQKEQAWIGSRVQRVPTVTGLACITRDNVKTVMLVNSVMEGTLHLQRISVHQDTFAR